MAKTVKDIALEIWTLFAGIFDLGIVDEDDRRSMLERIENTIGEMSIGDVWMHHDQTLRNNSLQIKGVWLWVGQQEHLQDNFELIPLLIRHLAEETDTFFANWESEQESS